MSKLSYTLREEEHGFVIMEEHGNGFGGTYKIWAFTTLPEALMQLEKLFKPLQEAST